MCPALTHGMGEALANILNDFKSCESLYLEARGCIVKGNILTLLTCDCSSLWSRSGDDVIHCSQLDLRAVPPFIALSQVPDIRGSATRTRSAWERGRGILGEGKTNQRRSKLQLKSVFLTPG